MNEKAKFGSKLGLVAATVGSAVGLGNVWRFPAEAQAMSVIARALRNVFS